MARKTYSEEFRRDAVELYRSTSGATVAGIAADLGIMNTTLSSWLKAAGVPVRGRYPHPDGEPPPDGEPLLRRLPGYTLGWLNSKPASGS